MKAIMMSIMPECVTKILNGEKTIEIRKSAPKCELPIDVYIYCTKNKLHYSVGALMFNRDDCFKRSVDGTYKYGDSVELMGYSPDYPYDKNNFLNGKVVANFTLREVEELYLGQYIYDSRSVFYKSGVYKGEWKDVMERYSRLTESQIDEYLGNGDRFYAWHISDLVIFDEPMELNKFYHSFKRKRKEGTSVLFDYDYEALRQRTKFGYEYVYPLYRAPQSWCYVEER